MKICLCQYDIEWENKKKNKEKIEDILADVSNIDLIVLPETSLSGFSFNRAVTTLTRSDMDFFISIAKKKASFVCAGGVIEEKNSCIVVNNSGKVVLETSKIHLFSVSGENMHHKPGSQIANFRIGKVTITPFICYDLRFAPLFWLSAHQTDIFLVIANWPETRRNHWKTLLSARAIENQSFVIGVNRIGKSPYESYCGDSSVIDPQGRVIFDAGNRCGAFVVEINPEDVENCRKNFPVLKDRKNFSDYTGLQG